MSYLPYLETIKSRIQTVFPTSKVTVWAEDSPFYPYDMTIRIVVNVDNYSAYTNIYIKGYSSEEHIADILIAEIKEVIGNGL